MNGKVKIIDWEKVRSGSFNNGLLYRWCRRSGIYLDLSSSDHLQNFSVFGFDSNLLLNGKVSAWIWINDPVLHVWFDRSNNTSGDFGDGTKSNGVKLESESHPSEYWVSLHPISNPSIFCLHLFHKQITAVKQNLTGLVATLYQTCF